jgi:hypothetical protein
MLLPLSFVSSISGRTFTGLGNMSNTTGVIQQAGYSSRTPRFHPRVFGGVPVARLVFCVVLVFFFVFALWLMWSVSLDCLRLVMNVVSVSLTTLITGRRQSRDTDHINHRAKTIQRHWPYPFAFCRHLMEQLEGARCTFCWQTVVTDVMSWWTNSVKNVF